MSDDPNDNMIPVPPEDVQARLVKEFSRALQPVIDALIQLAGVMRDHANRIAKLEREVAMLRVRPPVLDIEALRDEIGMAVIQESGSLISNLIEERLATALQGDPGRQ